MSSDKTTRSTVRQQRLHDLVHSEGFKFVEEIFVEKIMDLQSIMNLPTDSADNVLVDIKVRINVINELKEILATIKGEANVAEFDDDVEEDFDIYKRD